MKKRLTYISPLQAGIVYGAMMGIVSLIIVPFFLIATLLGHAGVGVAAGVGMVFVIFLPILYAVIGFIAGVLSAFIYNILAKITGGLELEFTDVA